jgi:hypothetical protein
MTPAAGLHDPLHLGDWYSTASAPQRLWYLQLVPDGVARVRVVFSHGAVDASPKNNLVVIANPPNGRTEQVRSVTWYGHDGRVIPTSQQPWREAIAARQGAMLASFRAASERIPDRAPAALIAHVPVFAGTQRPVTESGITIWHPSLQSLPLVPLQTIQDPKAVREIKATAGVRVWLDPGPALMNGRWVTNICIVRSQGFPSACSGSVTQVLAQGLWLRPFETPTFLIGFVPDTNRTVTLRLSGGRTRIVAAIHGVVITPVRGVTAIVVRGIDGATAVVPAPQVR